MRRFWTKEKVLEKIKEFHKKLGHRPTKYEVGSLYSESRKFFGTWGNALRSLGYKVKHFQDIRIPNLMTKDLAYFIGIVLSDGHLVYRKGIKYDVKLYTSYKNEKYVLLRLIKDLFDYNAAIRVRKYGFNKLPNYEIIISSRHLVEFLKNEFQIPSGKKSKIIRVPRIFFKNKELFYSLLRGIIDGDGCVGSHGVNISSSSKLFLIDIKRILTYLKIKTYSIVKDTNHVYQLTIPPKESITIGMKIYKGIKYFYPRVKDKWDESVLIYDRIRYSNPALAQAGIKTKPGAIVEQSTS